jgi:hypothetical protein
MNLSYGAFFCAALNANAIADLQHFPFLPASKYSILRRMVAAKEDFSF